MRKIPLTQGKYALVDDDIFEEFNQLKWCAHKDGNTFYAKRWISSNAMINMHHEILGYPLKGFMTDHENGNGLDNQRHNLRFVTNRQNCQNKRNMTKASQYPGVSWHGQSGKWRARIWINSVSKHLGLFVIETDAFEAYRNAINILGETMVGEQ